MNLTLERIANVLQSEVAPYSSVVADASEEVRLMWGYVVQCQSRLDAGDVNGFIRTFGVFRVSAESFLDRILNPLSLRNVQIGDAINILIRMDQKVGAVEERRNPSIYALIGNLLEMMTEIRLLRRFVNNLKRTAA
jgi:hypothetical protein